MTKEQLIKKVYRCIDETYPDTTEQDLEEFNIPAFLEEAVRWVVKVVPVGALGEGTPYTSLTLPEDGWMEGVGNGGTLAEQSKVLATAESCVARRQ